MCLFGSRSCVPDTNEALVITIDSLHHLGICVTDLTRAKQFYGGVLGLRELPRPRSTSAAPGTSSATVSCI